MKYYPIKICFLYIIFFILEKYFDKLKSWVKPGKESDYALRHEQNHFNVSYIATNKFVKTLKAAKFTTQNYNQLLNELYKQSMNDLQTMQNDYDGQTQNGIIKR